MVNVYSINKARIIQFVIVLFVFITSCSKKTNSVPAPLTGTPEIIITTLLNNQGIIWGFDFLPNGNILFTQKNRNNAIV
jgi:hypothetical protein